MIQITECPRDAMQGIKSPIPTQTKAAYINQLLQVGFETIDFGSFVSPKAVPQMKDTAEVLSLLDLKPSSSKLLAIIANERGAQDASAFKEIDVLGFPFSVSEEFQQRNTHSGREESLERVKRILDITSKSGQHLLIYLSMGFGNPYGEEWSAEIVREWTEKLNNLGIQSFALSDTIGTSTPEQITQLFPLLKDAFPEAIWGMHLHTPPHQWKEKMEAAYQAGCRRFDGAIKGYGGCPMAKDDLTGNMPTEHMIDYLSQQESLSIDFDALDRSVQMAGTIFP